MKNECNDSVSLELIHEFIATELLEDETVQIENDEDLLLSGFLDSISVIRLVAYLEKKSNLSIPPEDITLENFGSLTQIHQYMCSRK